MLFDKLAGIVERQLPQFKKLLDQVHLFHLDVIPHLILPKRGDISEEERHEAEDYFIMPFDTVAVEDKASCVIITPVNKGISGIWQEWYCLEITDLKNNDGKTHRPNASDALKSAQTGLVDDAYTIAEGRITITRSNTSDYSIVSVPNKYYFGNKDNITDENYTNKLGLNTKLLWEALANDLGNNAMTCLEELMLLMHSKERFVLEKLPLKPKTRGKQIPRSHQRTTYTILKVGDIHELMDRDPAARQARAALTESHYRRRHYRFLKNEKYKRNEDGTVKRVLIDPIWVGPKEARVGQHVYKVRLDM